MSNKISMKSHASPQAERQREEDLRLAAIEEAWPPWPEKSPMICRWKKISDFTMAAFYTRRVPPKLDFTMALFLWWDMCSIFLCFFEYTLWMTSIGYWWIRNIAGQLVHLPSNGGGVLGWYSLYTTICRGFMTVVVLIPIKPRWQPRKLPQAERLRREEVESVFLESVGTSVAHGFYHQIYGFQ